MTMNRGYTFGPTEEVTNTKLHQLVDDADPAAGSIILSMLADAILSANGAGRAKMENGFVTLAKLADGILTADGTGRAKMEDEFVTLAKLVEGILSADEEGLKRMADGFFAAHEEAEKDGRRKFADGFFTADEEGRKLFEDGFITPAMLASETFGAVLPAGAVWSFARQTAPDGWIKADGAAVARATYEALDNAIYVGDAANATAVFGYRTTSEADPDANRDINGDYIVLPDLRGEFVRGADEGRGVDAGRDWASSQQDALQNITGHFRGGHQAPQTDGAFEHTTEGFGAGNVSGQEITFDASRVVRTADETRPRNVTLLYCIKT
jgi:hypothetical protein